MSKGVVLVPTDFTSVGDCAINHGGVMAKSSSRKLIILHVVEKFPEVDGAKNKVNEVAIKAASEFGIEVEGMVRVGNIFEDIGETAAELGAKLIIMGTHGAKGMQRFVGSYAMKVVTNSIVPFIIVQEKRAETNGYANIILPLDLENATKQKLSYAVEIAKHFNSKIHLLFEKVEDAIFKQKLAGNIIFAKKYLAENNVSFTTKVSEGDDDFEGNIIRYAVSNNCDLIAIMNLDDGFLSNIMGESSEQELITNEAQIPVLVVNPTATITGGGVGLFS
ncbi:MAG: universal stress protein [Flavobacteriales bacterium]|nr:universal stress protein [Flavobacteriales bacterium]MBT6746638.1 universal stress protein [Flavobacteriales bacterium]